MYVWFREAAAKQCKKPSLCFTLLPADGEAGPDYGDGQTVESADLFNVPHRLLLTRGEYLLDNRTMSCRES